MPIEVEDIQEKGEDTQGNAQNNGEIVQDSPGNDQDTPEKVEVPAPKKKGRPPGAKNKPKAEPAPKPVVAPKPKAPRKRALVSPFPPESESEEAPTPPPSPATQRRSQWAAYRQRQVDAHQARQNHYTQALDKMLGF